MPSGQSLFDNWLESSAFGCLVGTNDTARAGVFGSWLSYIFVVVRETQRIKKHELVYSYLNTLHVPSMDKNNSALMQLMIEQLDGNLAPFVIPLVDKSECISHTRKKVAIHYGNAAQVVLELPKPFEQIEQLSCSDWVNITRAKLEIGKKFDRIEDIADIISVIETRLQENGHSEVSALFADLDTKNTPIAFLIASLRITLPCRASIPAWSKLLSSAKEVIDAAGRDSNRLLRGLTD